VVSSHADRLAYPKVVEVLLGSLKPRACRFCDDSDPGNFPTPFVDDFVQGQIGRCCADSDLRS